MRNSTVMGSGRVRSPSGPLEALACDALVIEANIVLCWALAELREAQAPPLRIFRAPQSDVVRQTRDRRLRQVERQHGNIAMIF
jgi:hypothetical protein